MRKRRGEERREENDDDDDENVDRRILCMSVCVESACPIGIQHCSSFIVHISTRKKRATNKCLLLPWCRADTHTLSDTLELNIIVVVVVESKKKKKKKKGEKEKRSFTHDSFIWSSSSSSSSCRLTSNPFDRFIMVNYTCGVTSNKSSLRRSSNSQLTLLRKQNERYRLRRRKRKSNEEEKFQRIFFI